VNKLFGGIIIVMIACLVGSSVVMWYMIAHQEDTVILQKRLSEVETYINRRTVDRYYRHDAIRDFAETYKRIDGLERRINKLEVWVLSKSRPVSSPH
jgi:hypothetical protein